MNRTNFQSAKVGYSTNTQFSIRCNSSYGPAFGKDYDLYCKNGDIWSSYTQNSYSKIDIPPSLVKPLPHYVNDVNVDDYEVFQVK